MCEASIHSRNSALAGILSPIAQSSQLVIRRAILQESTWIKMQSQCYHANKGRDRSGVLNNKTSSISENVVAVFSILLA